MDGEKCEIILSILKNGSMSGAAQELNYTQSGISRAVEAIEREAGFRVFTRGKSGALLTREGEQLLPSVRELAYWSRQYEQTARRLCGAETGRLAVGSSYARFFPWLTRVVSGFHEKHPGVTVELCTGPSITLAERMSAKALDFGIITRREGAFRSKTVGHDELMLLLPSNHRLAEAERISPDLCEHEPYIEIYAGVDTDSRRCFRRRCIEPDTAFSTPDNLVACGMVRAGLGVALVNRVVAEEFGSGVVCVPLDPPEHVDICVISPPEEVISPAARLFYAYAERFLGEVFK